MARTKLGGRRLSNIEDPVERQALWEKRQEMKREPNENKETMKVRKAKKNRKGKEAKVANPGFPGSVEEPDREPSGDEDNKVRHDQAEAAKESIEAIFEEEWNGFDD